jgi:uncharacterized protein
MSDDAAPLGPLRQVILQATSFCNLDCTYCYLPDRATRNLMSDAVVAALGQRLRDCGLLADELEVRWHAGEPLTAPVAFYRRACRELSAALADRVALRFSVQTNATPISDAWCELFAEFDFDVGVSIDGPASIHDAYRRTRRGSGTHARAMAGIERLRAAGHPFSTISVVTDATLCRQDEFIAFLEDLRPASIGLNPEETEGHHRSGLLQQVDFRDRYTEFLRAMWRLEARTGIPVREFSRVRVALRSGMLPVRNVQIEPLCLLNVDVAGNMSTYSPELLGWKDATFDDYIFGNALDPAVSLSTWPPGFSRLAEEIERGRTLCRDRCPYFKLCGGGAAANKWAENGTFASAETGACRLNTMAVVDVVLAELEAGSRR